MTGDAMQAADRYAFFRFNQDAWSLMQMAALATWPLNVTEASNWELLAICTWHSCPIARAEAEMEMHRRGVQFS